VALGLLSGCRAAPHGVGAFDSLHANQHVDEGERLLAEHNAPAAAKSFEAALRLDPRNARANARLGRILAQSGELELAAEHYARAVRSCPTSFEYALALARCYSRQAATSLEKERLLQAAARAYRHAQSLDSTSFSVTLELARCYRHLGETQWAISSLKEAAALNPRAAEVHAELGAIYHRCGDHAASVSEYAIALREDGDNCQYHNGIGRAYMALARAGGSAGARAREQAIAHFRRSLEIDSTQAYVKGMLRRLEPYQWQAVRIIPGGAEPD